MKKTTIESTLRRDTAKTEFWIGLVTVFLFIGLASFVGVKAMRKYQASHQQKIKIISPIPLANDASEKKEMTPTPTPIMKPKLLQIKKLADTDGAVTIAAESNDTFWNISQRYCGDGQYFRTIENLNGYGYRQLQADDKIVVYCY